MKKNNYRLQISDFRFLLILICNLQFVICNLSAVFDDTQSFSARALALGGAYTALSDDATGVNTNPAGISQLPNIEICGVYSPLYSDNCYYGTLAAVVPYGYNTFGVSFIRNSVINTYSEDTYSFAYSRILKENVFFGFNLRLLNISAPGYSKYNDPAYSGGKTAMSYDIGYLHRILDWFSYGLKLENINQPTIKLLSTTGGEEMKTKLKAGVAFKPKNAVFSVDIDTDKNVYFGSEMKFADFFSLRLGLNENSVTSGFGFSLANEIKIDFGFLFHKELGILYRTGLTFNL